MIYNYWMNFISKNHAWLKFSYCLLAALDLIIVHSVYVGQLLRASAASLIMHKHRRKRGVAYER